MFEVDIYEDARGQSPISDFIEDLNKRAKTNKNARIRLKKIVEYIELLKAYGTRAGLPATRHLDGDIWELRPLNDRILLAYWKDNKFILLHHFVKKSKKTPRKEIEQAKLNLSDVLLRGE